MKSSSDCDFLCWKCSFPVKWSFQGSNNSVISLSKHPKWAHRCTHFRVGRELCFTDDKRTKDVWLISKSQPINWRNNGLEPALLTSSPMNFPNYWYIGSAELENQGNSHLDFCICLTTRGQFSRIRLYPFCTQPLPAQFQTICI